MVGEYRGKEGVWKNGKDITFKVKKYSYKTRGTEVLHTPLTEFLTVRI